MDQPGEGDEAGAFRRRGEAVGRPAVGGRHLVVEADRLRPAGRPEGDRRQTPRGEGSSAGGVWITE
ncbi:hypothetical protein GCM10009731_47700 [Streptomyces globosus]